MPLRRADATDMESVARLFRQARTVSLPFLPVLHTPEEDRAYFTKKVLSASEVWVADEGGIIGFVARRGDWIDHLYVAPDAQRRGVGTALLARAMEGASRLSLWAFQKNAGAQRFYMARGWRPVLHTDGAANEEREPDTRFEFSSAATVAAELSLVAPCPEMVADYISAMLAGWSPSTTRDISATEIAALRADEAAHLRSLAFGEGLVTLADGSQAPRLPGKTFWMWDGGFCGSINFRHVPGTEELPSHVSGHIGYSVVPWKRRRGYGTKALALMLASVRDTGLARVRLTCDETNMFSRAVIERNGGVLIGREPHEDGPTKLGFWLPVA